MKLLHLTLLLTSLHTLAAEKRFTLLGPNAKPYASTTPGILGGHRKLKLYGSLQCASALRWLEKGHYRNHRVFFASESHAIAAGYHPCALCSGGVVEFRASSAGADFVMRLADEGDIARIKTLYNHRRRQLPFITRTTIAESIGRRELLIVIPRAEPERIAGVVRWYARRDGWNTIHELAVHTDFERQQLATELINQVPRPRRLKCPQDLTPANRFYAQVGLVKIGAEGTRTRRKLWIWADPPPEGNK